MATAATDAPLRGFFASRDGLQLYHEIWPAHGAAKATVLFVHGYGDHCARYPHASAHFTSRGFEGSAPTSKTLTELLAKFAT